MTPSSCSRRVRVERGIYRQPNGKYAVCFRHARKLRFRTIGFDLSVARWQREALIAAVRYRRSRRSFASTRSSHRGLSASGRGSLQANATSARLRRTSTT
jgi:hypothetical protein